MSGEIIEAGDIVRVKDASSFIASFAKKITDRDAVVNWVGPDSIGQFKSKASVTFQKRAGRGKEFRETMSLSDLQIVRKGDIAASTKKEHG